MGWSTLGLVVLIAAGAAWIGIRGWLAKDQLEASIPLAARIQEDFSAGNIPEAVSTAEELVDHAHRAASLTGDPIWRLGEAIPFLGANLSAVRQAAEITDSVAAQAVYPLVSNVSQIGVDSFRPVNGAVNLQPLMDAQPIVSAARDTLAQAADEARQIDTAATIGQVSDAVGTLEAAVVKANDLMQGVDRAVTLVPRMLGAEGPRNYLLLFQNPAELRAGGGITSALAQIATNEGTVDLTQQASSADFRPYPAPVVEQPAGAQLLYGDRATTYIQNTTLVPDFALTGQVASQMWADQYGTDVDGVISFDPVALSYLLKATGPITLPSTGFELTSKNAVQFLLSDVYSIYPDPRVQDVVFAEAAQAVFSAVSTGNLDPGSLLNAIAQAGEEGRFKIWSAHPEDQAVLADTTLAGGLPISSPDSTGIGVYFNDATGGKMDYYLDASVSTQTESCRADGRPGVRTTVTLTNTAPADAATSLPAYVTGNGLFGVTPGNMRTLVYAYAPVSADPAEPVLLTGVDAGKEAETYFAGLDEGRNVVGFSVELAPGESRTMIVDFALGPGASMDITPDITPTVHPTVYSTEINRSFSGC